MSSEFSAYSFSSAFASANRGPLNYVFTPPASCMSETTLVSYLTKLSSPSSAAFTTTKVFINHFSWGDSACYPPTIATTLGTTRWNNGYYYSPGICPSGWASACQQQTSAFGWSTTLASDTTAVLCCPSSWSCIDTGSTVNGHGCSTVLSAGQILSSVWPAPNPTPSVTMDLPLERTLITWEVPANTSAVCDAIPIMWQNTDIPILSMMGLPFTSSPPSTFATSTPITRHSTSAIPIMTGTSAASNHPITKAGNTSAGISQGVKTAIGVTVPIVLLGIIFGVFFFFRRRKRHFQPLRHELTSSVKRKYQNTMVEADPDHGLSEMTGSPTVFEMADTRTSSDKDAKEDIKPLPSPDPLIISLSSTRRSRTFRQLNVKDENPPSYS